MAASLALNAKCSQVGPLSDGFQVGRRTFGGRKLQNSTGLRQKFLRRDNPRQTQLVKRGSASFAILTSRTKTSNWPSSLPSPSSPSEHNWKGWIDEQGHENPGFVAELRNISIAAQDRSEMHAILGVQRDNWNKLCLPTVTMATIGAAILAAMNGAPQALSMSVAACLLNGGATGFMLLANKFQPSQLAEEQRTAARFFKMLAKGIESTLLIDPRLREDALVYLENNLARLEALDTAFPLHLTPDGIEKFPKIVRPSALSPPVDLSEPEMPANNRNGWTDAITEDLKATAEKIKTSDLENYLRATREKENQNMRLAIVAPAFAAAATFFNMVQCLPGVQATDLAAVCSIMAMFCFSFSHAGQVGMIYELYRNCAGAYADMDHSIQRAIRLPVCQREDGALFHQKIALQLGRRDRIPLVNVGDKTAGKLF